MEGKITLTDKKKANYKPLLDGGERYGYEVAKVNSIQYKNHHYFVMLLNKTSEEYTSPGIFDDETMPMDMCNFYMNADKQSVEGASHGGERRFISQKNRLSRRFFFFRLVDLFDFFFEAHVGTEDFRDKDGSVFLVVVFQEGDEHSRRCDDGVV